MFNCIHPSQQHLRLWLIAAAAVLALVSVLETGHVHGGFTQADDQCTLCQHSVVLNILNTVSFMVVSLLLASFVNSAVERFISHQRTHCALIRAPPTQLHPR